MEKTPSMKRMSWDFGVYLGHYFSVSSETSEIEIKPNEAERAERKFASRFKKIDELARHLDSVIEKNQSQIESGGFYDK